MAAKKRKHITLTLTEKNDIIEQLKTGTSIKTLTNKYGVARTTIYEIKNKKDEIQKFISSVNNYGRKTLRKPDNPAVEDALRTWILQEQIKNSRLSGPLLAKKARYFYKKITGKNDFCASSGWLNGFKSRYGIQFLKRYKRLKVCNEDDSNKTIDNKSTCEKDKNFDDNEEMDEQDNASEDPFVDEISVFDNFVKIEKEYDQPLIHGRTSSLEAVKCFATCLKWAEENGCSSTEILLLRHMQNKALDS